MIEMKCHVNHFFDFCQCNLSGIEALEFSCIYTRVHIGCAHRPTLQVATILVAMVPKTLKLATGFVKSLAKPKELVTKWRPSKDFNLEGCRRICIRH